MSLAVHDMDASLVSSLRNGDRLAFEQIYRKYAAELLHYACNRLGDREEAEEMVQDVFVSLWTRRASLDVSSLRHYLFSSVKYKIIRFYQHQGVRKKYEEHFRLFETVYENTSDHEQDGEIVHSLISKGLAQLPERCQFAVRLRLDENLSNSDIARRMNIKKSTVEKYMVSALNHLKESYRQMYKTQEN